MRKWEYLVVLRHRVTLPKKQDAGYLEGGPYETLRDGKWQDLNMDKYLQELGEDGWELVTVICESSLAVPPYEIYASFVAGTGHIQTIVPPNFTGFTSSHKWVFKRQKE